jgi:hypothetical protein
MDPNSSTLPPLGDPGKADKYIASLARLIAKDKVTLTHTDLNKFDVTTMQNHYRVDLGEYEVEVSHSVQPETNKDFYTIIFNNTKKLQDGKTDKVILGYIHLTDDQYGRFKISADEYLERRQKDLDKERFAQNLAPIEQLLSQMDSEAQMEEPVTQTSENLPTPEELKPTTPLDQH